MDCSLPVQVCDECKKICIFFNISMHLSAEVETVHRLNTDIYTFKVKCASFEQL